MHLRANLACCSKFSGAIASDPQPSMLTCIASFLTAKGGKAFFCHYGVLSWVTEILELVWVEIWKSTTALKEQQSKAAKLQHSGRAIPLPVISTLRQTIVIKICEIKKQTEQATLLLNIYGG